MPTALTSRAALLGLATAATLTLGPALPAAQAHTAPPAPSPAAATLDSAAPGTAVATLLGTPTGVKAKGECARWQKNYAKTLQVRPCLKKKNGRYQPQGAWQNLTNKKITVRWILRYKTTRYGAWKICKQGKGPLKPKQHWVTWCGWYKKVYDVRTTGTVVKR
ncbi:hypothetical protein GCM10009678_88490 [Actinomadura kijaniata]|uniref:Uncharacterized protein n=1 Tax=Actinomadura namibiensis TaxID=182080 RepID=A0A7W3LKN3_ACTNM|nr:hypothetical protein [Actinomadura namibiensis]MBA8949891.1 hypothetical protein [Actinomadura namibiensis]